MIFNDQKRICHAEPFAHSLPLHFVQGGGSGQALLKGIFREASVCPAREILPLRKLRAAAHYAQDDKTLPISFVKVHHRGPYTPAQGTWE